jgi:hypothetical protein
MRHHSIISRFRAHIPCVHPTSARRALAVKLGVKIEKQGCGSVCGLVGNGGGHQDRANLH